MNTLVEAIDLSPVTVAYDLDSKTYDRKAFYVKIEDYMPTLGKEECEIFYQIRYYFNGEEYRSDGLKPFVKGLLINNTTAVDENGDYVIDANGVPSFDGVAVLKQDGTIGNITGEVRGEREYLIWAIKNNGDVYNLVRNGAIRADVLAKRFNIL